MIDLHLHTTASDGRLAPAQLVARAAAAGLTVISVTDHDTVAGLGEAHRAAQAHGIELVDGIEITAVRDGRDVHVLGYFVDATDTAFNTFLFEQRTQRVDRVRAICLRLAQLGVPVDADELIDGAARLPGASLGRPAIARAMVAAGHVTSVHEAFARYLGAGEAAFVPRLGAAPASVVEVIHRAGGLASMAHPGVTKQPAVMAALVDAGLDAIEVFHSDHDDQTRQVLQAFAAEHRLLVTGGSDFHGDDGRDRPLGRTTLPQPAFALLRAAWQAA